MFTYGALLAHLRYLLQIMLIVIGRVGHHCTHSTPLRAERRRTSYLLNASLNSPFSISCSLASRSAAGILPSDVTNTISASSKASTGSSPARLIASLISTMAEFMLRL